MQKLLPRPLADLHVADVCAVDCHADCRANLVESVVARSSRIDVQKIVNRVVHHTQNMRMTRYEYPRMQLRNTLNRRWLIMPRPSSDMGHQHRDILRLEKLEFVIDTARKSAVDIAADGMQRTECGYPVGQFERPYIASMPYLVRPVEEMAELVVECSVGVGYYSYAFHGIKDNIFFRQLYILGNLFLCHVE